MKVSFLPYVQGCNYSRFRDGSPVVTQKFAVAIHNTANDATAEGEASFATRRTDDVSSHFYFDNNSGVQSLDTRWRAWHSGSVQGNDNAIAVEITGVDSWSRDMWIKSVAWDVMGRALAEVCRTHNIPVKRVPVSTMKANPRSGGFYGHNDMRLAWGGTSHTDPGPNFPWDVLFNHVTKHLNPPITPEVTAMKDAILAREEGKPEVFIGNGITRRHIANEAELAGVQYWVAKRGGDPTVYIFEPGTIGVIGVLVA